MIYEVGNRYNFIFSEILGISLLDSNRCLYFYCGTNKNDLCILRSPADSDAFQSGRCAEHNGRPETPIIVS